VEKKIKMIESFILEKMKSSRLPALSLGIMQKGKVIYQRGFGRRNLEDGQPATPDTLYGIGSITKSFTCLSLLQLQEESRLSLSDPVSDYLDFNLKPAGRTVEIQHLMSHTSGIPGLAYAEAAILNSVGEEVEDVPVGDVEDMLTFIRESQDWLETEPGKRWFYLNEGYVLLGGIIARVSGISYQKYLKENIFSPLEMNRTFFSRENVEADKDAACPYLVTDNERIPQSYLYGSITSDGGIISNVQDMLKYLKLFLQKEDNEIITPGSLIEMMQPRINTPSLQLYQEINNQKVVKADYSLDNHPGYYGLGLSIEEDFFGYRKIGHGGSVLVATAQLNFIPEEELGLVLLANGSGYPLSQLSSYLLALLLEEDPDRLDFRQSETRLEKLTGTYQAFQGNYSLEISRQGDFLKLKNISSSLGDEEILIPDRLAEERIELFALQGGKKLPVEFYFQEGETVLLYGRYKLKKVSELVD